MECWGCPHTGLSSTLCRMIYDSLSQWIVCQTHCLEDTSVQLLIYLLWCVTYQWRPQDFKPSRTWNESLSQVGHEKYVHEMRQKSQKFWHKHNKLENWTGSVFQFIMFVSKFLWFMPHFVNIPLLCRCPPYSRLHTLELNVSANVWSNCSTMVLAVLAQ